MIFRNLLKNQLLIKNTTRLLGSGQPIYAFASQPKFSEKLGNLRKGTSFNVSKDSTLNQLVTNYGVNQFIQRVYKTTGLSIMGALSASQLAISMGLPITSPGFCMFGGIIATIGGFIGTLKTQPEYVSYQEKGENVIKAVNSPLRLGLFGLGVSGLGLSASPFFMYLAASNPTILPAAIGISSAIFGSASVYALMQPKGSLLSWGSSLRGALFGIIGLQIAGMLTGMIMGPNLFTHICHRADTFIGLGVFSALVAYDTHVAIQGYQQGIADHLLVSTDFILDFWNILMRVAEVLRIFGSSD